MLSSAAQSLWAKTSDGQSLCEHMRRSADVAVETWREWLAHGVQKPLVNTLGDGVAERVFVFLCAAHDIGKATPMFQYRPGIPVGLRDAVLDAGLPEFKPHKALRHEFASMLIAERNGVDRTIAIIIGGHHGRPPTREQINSGVAEHFGFGADAWVKVQHELYNYALMLAGLQSDDLCKIKLPLSAQMALSGAVTLCDWIASSGQTVTLPDRWMVRSDWDELSFGRRFLFEANAIQRAATDIASRCDNVGMLIVEAAMGTGKTEAALAVAEILARKTSRTGVFFGLPTRATADGILDRFIDWIDKAGDGKAHALALAHGKAAFNQRYGELRRVEVSDDEGGVYIHSWLSGRRLQLLADFAVGTIDHLLMCALRHKFIALRHLGLASKVVIIDEVHAYDAYMDVYLYRALRWLGEYGVPVVVLSATLPSSTRNNLLGAYLNRKDVNVNTTSYPLITYTDGDEVATVVPQIDTVQTRVTIERFDGDVADRLERLTTDGGVAGVIVNTVKRAQSLAAQLAERFGDEQVMLLHSYFTAADRAARERQLLARIGKHGERPRLLIVVGTQVLEQSLDIDFDVLFSDICPMDLLLQRIGRMHRHDRRRPKLLAQPVCYVMQSAAQDGGSVAVYGEYSLMCTRYLLPDSITLPDDISTLVQEAYGEVSAPPDEAEAFEMAKNSHQSKIDKDERKAENYRLRAPTGGKPSLLDALKYSSEIDNSEGEASVRNGDQAVEVILLQRVGGEYRIVSGDSAGCTVAHDGKLDNRTAFQLACCTMPLPRSLTSGIGAVLKELADIKAGGIPSGWDNIHWLRDALYLVLDDNMTATLRGKSVRYDRSIGLVVVE